MLRISYRGLRSSESGPGSVCHESLIARHERSRAFYEALSSSSARRPAGTMTSRRPRTASRVAGPEEELERPTIGGWPSYGSAAAIVNIAVGETESKHSFFDQIAWFTKGKRAAPWRSAMRMPEGSRWSDYSLSTLRTRRHESPTTTHSGRNSHWQADDCGSTHADKGRRPAFLIARDATGSRLGKRRAIS